MKDEKVKSKKDVADLKYRPLKKELKKIEKAIRSSIENNELPGTETMTEFIAEVRVMISYPGFGDEYYDSFLAACLVLQEVFKKKDFASFSAQFETVKALKKECHARYKDKE